MRGGISGIKPILRSALSMADPSQAVYQVLHRKGNHLTVKGMVYDLERIQHIYTVAAGKASIAMVKAAVKVIGDRITSGIVVVPHGSPDECEGFSVFHAGHPTPDRKGTKAAEAILHLAQQAREDDLVIGLISGGASSLLPAPVSTVTLQDKRKTTDRLLKSGAMIDEINMVRKHLSRIKGGWLAAQIFPASSLTLLLSDVLSGDLSSIASGPTVPDPTRFEDAIGVLKKYGIWGELPESVLKYLQTGHKGRYPETPKPGNPVFEKARSYIVSDNRLSMDAAADQAQSLGYNVMVLGSTLQGEAREVAKVFGAMAREIHRTGRPISRPACLIAGGELTVTVKGRGSGGRAQEFVLASALEIAGLPDTTVAGFGTDGLDGPTEAAGAVADGSTLDRSRGKGIGLRKTLLDNDAYTAFEALGDLILTGPTGTNVNDLYILLVT